MSVEAPTVIKLGRGWKPFANQPLEDSSFDRIVSPESMLEGYGKVRAELFPMETEDRRMSLPMKELKKGSQRLNLADRSPLYAVRILLVAENPTAEDMAEMWEDRYGTGKFSTLNCALVLDEHTRHMALSNLARHSTNSLKAGLREGKVEIAFDEFSPDINKFVQEREEDDYYGFALTTGIDQAQDMEFSFIKPETT